VRMSLKCYITKSLPKRGNNMSKIFLLGIMAFLLSGCMGLTKPDFQITTNQIDKFADKTKFEIYSVYNRLTSKSICGGIHIDDKGLYLDPVANLDNNQILEHITLVALYYNAVSTDDFTNAVCGKKGFEPIREIIFLADDTRISIKTKPHDTDLKYYGWNNISKGYDGIYKEVSVGFISFEELMIIANSKNLDVKVIGDKNSQTFDEKELEDDFKSNLKKFLNTIPTQNKKVINATNL
jgi:hypothetical protein